MGREEKSLACILLYTSVVYSNFCNNYPVHDVQDYIYPPNTKNKTIVQNHKQKCICVFFAHKNSLLEAFLLSYKCMLNMTNIHWFTVNTDYGMLNNVPSFDVFFCCCCKKQWSIYWSFELWTILDKWEGFIVFVKSSVWCVCVCGLRRMFFGSFICLCLSEDI